MRKLINRIEVKNGNGILNDVSFYFDGSDERFNAGEFEPGSLTRRELEAIEYAIVNFNSEVFA